MYGVSLMRKHFRTVLQGKEAYMAESSTFYKAFGPAMDVLQKKGTAGNYLST